MNSHRTRIYACADPASYVWIPGRYCTLRELFLTCTAAIDLWLVILLASWCMSVLTYCLSWCTFLSRHHSWWWGRSCGLSGSDHSTEWSDPSTVLVLPWPPLSVILLGSSPAEHPVGMPGTMEMASVAAKITCVSILCVTAGLCLSLFGFYVQIWGAR